MPVIERVRSLNQLLQRYGRHSSSERLKGYILAQTCSKILGFLAEENVLFILQTKFCANYILQSRILLLRPHGWTEDFMKKRRFYSESIKFLDPQGAQGGGYSP